MLRVDDDSDADLSVEVDTMTHGGQKQMKIHRTLLLLATVAVGCAAPTDPSTSDSVNVGDLSKKEELSISAGSPWQPYSTTGLNNCNNEEYAFDGEILMTNTLHTDGSGGQHLTSLLRLRGTGVGLTSGAKYRTSEGGMLVENDLSPGTTTINQAFTGALITLGNDDAPNEVYHLNFHITINANGTVTAIVDSFDVSCH